MNKKIIVVSNSDSFDIDGLDRTHFNCKKFTYEGQEIERIILLTEENDTTIQSLPIEKNKLLIVAGSELEVEPHTFSPIKGITRTINALKVANPSINGFPTTTFQFQVQNIRSSKNYWGGKKGNHVIINIPKTILSSEYLISPSVNEIILPEAEDKILENVLGREVVGKIRDDEIGIEVDDVRWGAKGKKFTIKIEKAKLEGNKLIIEEFEEIKSETNTTSTPPEKDNNTNQNTNNTPLPKVIDKEFTIAALSNQSWGVILELTNPETLPEQTGNPRYQVINISPKTYANNLKAGNKIKITGIKIAADQAKVKSNRLDILDNYNTIELITKAKDTSNDNSNNNNTPWKSPLEIILEALVAGDKQLQTFLKEANINTKDEFVEKVINWGFEHTLINSDKKTLNYSKIKEFLGVGQTPPNNPNTPTPENPDPNNPDPQKPNGPNQPTPSPSNKPTNPITENNQKSEENIKEIDKSASLTEACTKAQTEINSLLERYGVKAEELSVSLWENQASWEIYLTSKLSTVNQVSQFTKKMKLAIMQQSKQNQQTNQQLSVPQLKTKIKQGIEELLKKYPQIKIESFPTLKNWKTDLEKKNDKTELINLERQLREAIIAASHQTSSTTNETKSTWPKKLLIGGSIFLGVAGIVSLVLIFRHKRILTTRRKKRQSKIL